MHSTIVYTSVICAIIAVLFNNCCVVSIDSDDDVDKDKGDSKWWNNEKTLSEDDNQFRAWDCSRPVDIRRVGSFEEIFCDDVTGGKHLKESEKTYQVLQKERYQRFSGWLCHVKMSRRAWQCGVGEHDTTFAEATIHDMFETTSAMHCQTWVNNKFYTDPNQVDHALKLGITNNIKYLIVGQDEVWTPPAGSVHSTQISCK